MARGPSNFRQRDLEVVLKALARAGQPVTGIEIQKSGLSLTIGNGSPAESVTIEQATDFDQWKARHEDSNEGA